MPNITMTIDEKTLKKAKKIAIEKNTTLTAMVRTFLNEVTEKEDRGKERVINNLKRSFSKSKVRVGKIKWRRDDLYEQKSL